MIDCDDNQLTFSRLSGLCRHLVARVESVTITNRHIHIINLFPALVVAGWQSGRHSHPFDEVHLVLQGSAVYHRHYGEEMIEPGGYLLHHAREYHAWSAYTEVLRLVIWFTAEPPLSSIIPDSWPASPAYLHDCEALFAEVEQGQPGWDERARAYLTVLMSRLLLTEYSRQPHIEKVEASLVANVETLLQQHIESGIHLSEIANEIGVSARHLMRLFARQAGETIGQRQLAFRMNHAAALLTYTDLSLQTISTRIGIADPSYFTRRFYQFFQENPSTYRKRTKSAVGPERRGSG